VSDSISIDEQLRSQIEAAAAAEYPTESIDRQIAEALCRDGCFRGTLGAGELAVILRNVVYTLFSHHHFAGIELQPVHNVPTMKVSIRNNEAAISYLVHIHKPIVAFLKFQYVLINDPVSVDRKIRLKRGSLKYEERTRRFDLKAKTGLAAVNVKELARRELQDVTGIILKTLPAQLEKQAVSGKLRHLELQFDGSRLIIHLEGSFEPLA